MNELDKGPRGNVVAQPLRTEGFMNHTGLEAISSSKTWKTGGKR